MNISDKQIWETYDLGINLLLYTLNELQKGSDEFSLKLVVLYNGIYFYSQERSDFSRFTQRVHSDALDPSITSERFNEEFYVELKKFLESQLNKC